MLKTLIRAWAGNGEDRVMVLRVPVELYSGLETLAFIANERRKDLGSAQGGSAHWELTSMEELVHEAIADMIRKHIRITEPRAATTPKYDYGAARIQRR